MHFVAASAFPESVESIGQDGLQSLPDFVVTEVLGLHVYLHAPSGSAPRHAAYLQRHRNQ